MKLLIMLFTIALMTAQSHRHSGTCYLNNDEDRYHSKHWKYVDMDYDDYFSFDSYGDRVRITEDFDLYINGKEISISSSERRMLKHYVRLHESIIENGIDIGLAGAAIGIEGAKLGVSSAAMAIRMIFDGDDDQFEKRIERMTNRIERKAEKLEERVEGLEEDVHKLAELSCAIKKRISELRTVRWF